MSTVKNLANASKDEQKKIIDSFDMVLLDMDVRQLTHTLAHMKKVKNVVEVSKDEQKKFIDSFNTVFLDMDGVIWLHFKALKGAPECIHNLKKIGKNIHYVTNNSISTREEIQKYLHINKFPAELSDIVNPHTIMISQLKALNIKDDIFLLGTETAKNLLKSNGYNLVPDPPFPIEESIDSILSYRDENRKVGAVVFDFDMNLTYMKMQRAIWYLRDNPKCVFLAALRDKMAPMGSKGPVLCFYHFTEAVQEVSGKDCIELGKPSMAVVNHLIKSYNVSDPRRALFIGDSIQSDMSVAAKGGFQKLLVLSGTDKMENIDNWEYPEEYKPEYYAQDLAALNEIIEKIYTSKLDS